MMGVNMLEKLVDVVTLSKKHCAKPILCELKYATQDNFLGRIVEGYVADARDIGLLTKEAAQKLCAAQNYFVQQHKMSILIFDSLRPLRAVEDFGQWMNAAPHGEYELQRKKLHYPHIEKNQLGVLGYVKPDVSRHCFGNVVDMSLVHIDDGSELNMGTIFDYFDELSHVTVTADQIGKEAYENRKLFFKGMEQFGFHVYEKEFWHFDYIKCEVDQPFDLEISVELRGLNANSVGTLK